MSLATVEFKPEGAGTRLVYPEQGAFLDGYDNAAQRELGTRNLLDNLSEVLRRYSESASRMVGAQRYPSLRGLT